MSDDVFTSDEVDDSEDDGESVIRFSPFFTMLKTELCWQQISHEIRDKHRMEQLIKILFPEAVHRGGIEDLEYHPLNNSSPKTKGNTEFSLCSFFTPNQSWLARHVAIINVRQILFPTLMFSEN